MRITELLEAIFKNSPCTKNCGGHRAGFKWAKDRPYSACDSRSPSFTKGCLIAKGYRVKKTKKEKPNGLD